MSDLSSPHPEKAPFPDGSFTPGHRMSGREAIEWIKRYRAIVGVSLREAKDAYDAGRPMPEAPDALADAQRFARQRSMEAAARDMFEALKAVNKLIAEAAMTGFNCHDGDWAERLFESQQATSRALSKATGGQHV